ncbi:HAMP domain-containing sensor histidine kinase [Nibrella viscosa]|uniref:histidine kinase n=1 Tax=Nibrella viscosa TaxID=1084524 RepID=A0ABP8K1Q4_9BACT
MTIRSRLTLLFTAIVSGLLLLFCLIIFWFAERYRQSEFRERLREEALTCAKLLFGKETISPELFRLLDLNNITVLNQEEIIVYNYQNRIVYESGTDYLTVTPEVLNRVRLETEIYWREGEREIAGVLFADPLNRLVVFASAVDIYGSRKQRNLALILAAGWLLATGVVFGAGRYFAGRSLKPMQRVINRVDEITAAQLNLRVEEGDAADEITQLARRFNRMLDRLEDAFRTQRAFVSHASHELRTPLTAITGQLEVALMADDDPEELRAMVRSVLDDVRGLNRLANGLLSLANVSMDESAVRLGPVQTDDLIWQARTEVRRMHPEYTIRVELPELGDTAPDLTLTGNAPLLHIALLNLMENGCKFSPDHQVTVTFESETSLLRLRFHNGGPPIPADELPEIFKPFRRGSNARQIAGHGVGLSLTERIVRLHRGRITIQSTETAGTTVTVELPRTF